MKTEVMSKFDIGDTVYVIQGSNVIRQEKIYQVMVIFSGRGNFVKYAVEPNALAGDIKCWIYEKEAFSTIEEAKKEIIRKIVALDRLGNYIRQ